jgi:hypothetical protein
VCSGFEEGVRDLSRFYAFIFVYKYFLVLYCCKFISSQILLPHWSEKHDKTIPSIPILVSQYSI